MPSIFNEPLSSALVTNQPSRQLSDLPTEFEQVELGRLQQLPQRERSITSGEGISSDDSAEGKGEIRRYLSRGRSSSSIRETVGGTRTVADCSSPEELEAQRLQMGRRKQSPRPETPISEKSGAPNGKANGDMESHLEMRRKHPSLESPTVASQTAHLLSRDSFSLDDEPPPTPITSNPDTSFFELPRQDRRNFLLLVLLYFLQGIPMGLASGSVPFLLKKHLSYGQIGVFSLASYPYSLKLLWSPIVDAVWSPVLGRRKSWIMPIQLCSGFGMIYLGSRIKEMMVAAGANDGSGVWNFTWWWFFLVFLCATQDIAVDGESLSIITAVRYVHC